MYYVYIRFNGAHPDADLACIIIPSISVFVKKTFLFFTTLKNETGEDGKNQTISSPFFRLIGHSKQGVVEFCLIIPDILILD